MVSFNPLVIGSIFQTPPQHHYPSLRGRRFQSPSNRVNIPNAEIISWSWWWVLARFNPLVIGSIFQTWENEKFEDADGNAAFQSPSNRVNIPNIETEVHAELAERDGTEVSIP